MRSQVLYSQALKLAENYERDGITQEFVSKLVDVIWGLANLKLENDSKKSRLDIWRVVKPILQKVNLRLDQVLEDDEEVNVFLRDIIKNEGVKAFEEFADGQLLSVETIQLYCRKKHPEY